MLLTTRAEVHPGKSARPEQKSKAPVRCNGCSRVKGRQEVAKRHTGHLDATAL